MSYKLYYSTLEVAQLLGITRQAVWQKYKAGKLRAKKMGRDLLFYKSQFKDLI